jgi:hypothetical protein
MKEQIEWHNAQNTQPDASELYNLYLVRVYQKVAPVLLAYYNDGQFFDALHNGLIDHVIAWAKMPTYTPAPEPLPVGTWTKFADRLPEIDSPIFVLSQWSGAFDMPTERIYRTHFQGLNTYLMHEQHWTPAPDF